MYAVRKAAPVPGPAVIASSSPGASHARPAMPGRGNEAAHATPVASAARSRSQLMDEDTGAASLARNRPKGKLGDPATGRSGGRCVVRGRAARLPAACGLADNPAMRYRRFGRTNLRMPVFSCGGMRYQHKWQDVAWSEVPRENQANVEAVIRRAIELGIHHIETARGYGSSEMQLGPI